MTVLNIKHETAAIPQVGPAVRGDEPKPALHPEPVSDRGQTGRQVAASQITGALVTLLPPETELNPKQQVMAEQFRVLRARVKALSRDFQLRTILITSALPSEGKTTVSANLAGSLSRVEGLRVLLMDFDLRHPSQHTIFGVEPEDSSPYALPEGKRWQDSVYQVNRRLDVLFGFRALAEPDRLLQSNRLEKLLQEAKANYDVVLIDSAPILAVADTQSLVPLVDCGLFVLNADTTPITAAREAVAQLQDKVVGCIVNRVSYLKSEGYYLNSGYGYGYGYGSKRTEN